MATIQEIRADIEREMADLDRQIESDRNEIRALLASAEYRGQTNLSQADDMRAEALMRSAERASAARRRKADALSQARALESEQDEQELRLNTVHSTGARRPGANRTASLTVTHNERTYHLGNDPTGKNFVADVCRAQVTGDPKAWSRLARHMDEEERERGQYVERAAGDATTTTGGGIVVPQYLVDLTAPAVAARRPFADACTHHELPPDGMSFIVPTISTATSAALQTTQLTAVSTTSIGESDLTLTVKTAAGSQNVSRQAADRSKLDDFVVGDLMARYATALDAELLNGASTGLDAVATGAATAGLTAAQIYSAVLGRQSGVEAALLGGRADVVLMHSRRWAFLSAQVASTWPFINNESMPTQAGGVSNLAGYGSGVRGQLPNGLAVVVDNNVVTNKGLGSNEDVIYVVPSLECHLFEDSSAPVMIRAEQPNAANLGILLVIFGYFAYTFQRYSAAMGKVTGLTPPTF
jgi:HK97 family phage major capsid protein